MINFNPFSLNEQNSLSTVPFSPSLGGEDFSILWLTKHHYLCPTIFHLDWNLDSHVGNNRSTY